MSFDALVRKAWRKNLLLSAHLELTYACNLDCTFCYNDRRKQGSPLSVVEWCAVLDDLAQMQVLNVVLSGGEPTVFPGFFDVGAHARRRGFVTRVKTNGHALRAAVLERLLAEVDPYILEVSLHGATAATHDRQTRVPGSFLRLIDNLRALRGRARVQLNAPLTVWNEDEIDALFALAAELGFPLRIDPEITPRDDGDVAPLALSPSASGLAHAFAAAERRGPHGADSEIAACASDDAKHCGAGSASLLIDPFGDVMPCVQWRRVIGNVRTQPVSAWWHSGVFDPMRRALVDVRRAVGAEVDHCPGIAERLTGRLDGVSRHAAERRAVRASLRVLPS